MRKAAYVALLVLAIATAWLWRQSREEDGRIEAVTLSVREGPDHGVVATLHNGSKGRVTVVTEPCEVEILADKKWTEAKYDRLACGNIDIQQREIAPGKDFAFAVRGKIDLVKPGQAFRVSVSASSGFNFGRVISNTVVLSQTKRG